MLMSHLGYLVMMSSGPPNGRKYYKIWLLMMSPLVAFSQFKLGLETGQKEQISTGSIEKLNLIILGFPKQYQPTYPTSIGGIGTQHGVVHYHGP